MKSNPFLLNPFVKIAGWRALIWGSLFTSLATGLCWATNIHFYSDIIFFPFGHRHFPLFILEQLLPWAALSLLLYLGGLVFSRSSIRLIDLLGTLALSRAPLLLIPALAAPGVVKEVVGVIPKYQALTRGALVEYDITAAEGILFAFICMAALAAVIWYIILALNAYRVCCNLKGSRLYGSFAVIFLAAEALAFMAIRVVYRWHEIPFFFDI